MINRTVLIVDDDMTALDIIDFLFEDKGFSVARRADGSSALEAVDEAEPDIVLLDLMMPGMSGQECARQLRAKGFAKPIIAFTALDDQEVHDEARQAGCNLVLTKPTKPSELIQHVESLLGQEV